MPYSAPTRSIAEVTTARSAMSLRITMCVVCGKDIGYFATNCQIPSNRARLQPGPCRPPPQHEHLHVVGLRRLSREAVDLGLDRPHYFLRRQRGRSAQIGLQPLVAVELVRDIHRLDHAVAEDEHGVVGQESHGPLLVRSAGANGERHCWFVVEGLDAAGSMQYARGEMTGVDVGEHAGFGVEHAEEQRHEHAIAVVLAKLVIDGLNDPHWGDLICARLPPKLYGHPDQTARARYEHRGRGSFSRDVADEKEKQMFRSIEEVVKIAAHLARGLHQGMDLDRLLRRAGG